MLGHIKVVIDITHQSGIPRNLRSSFAKLEWDVEKMKKQPTAMRSAEIAIKLYGIA